MNTRTIDNLASRGAVARSRRASLGGLAGAALAASISLVSLGAAKARKAKRKTCKKQSGACQSSVSAYCGRPMETNLEACEAALTPCCGSLKGCDAGDFYDCLIDALIALEESQQT